MTKHNKLVTAVILAIEGFVAQQMSRDAAPIESIILFMTGIILVISALAFAVWAAE